MTGGASPAGAATSGATGAALRFSGFIASCERGGSARRRGRFAVLVLLVVQSQRHELAVAFDEREIFAHAQRSNERSVVPRPRDVALAQRMTVHHRDPRA